MVMCVSELMSVFNKLGPQDHAVQPGGSSLLSLLSQGTNSSLKPVKSLLLFKLWTLYPTLKLHSHDRAKKKKADRKLEYIFIFMVYDCESRVI